jgi:transcriptional regulator with XRE-family HTH domain
VRAARAVLGWSQALLAERAGLDQARVSRIERGEQPLPGVAESLATALGLGPEELGVDGGEHAAG